MKKPSHWLALIALALVALALVPLALVPLALVACNDTERTIDSAVLQDSNTNVGDTSAAIADTTATSDSHVTAGDSQVALEDSRARDGAAAGDGSSTGPATPGFIDCGGASCTATSKICCVARASGDASSTSYACLAASATCEGNKVSCDEPGDCGSGEVCCRPSGGTAASCMAAASCSGNSARQRCHADGDCPTTLPKCCPSKSTSGGSCKSEC